MSETLAPNSATNSAIAVSTPANLVTAGDGLVCQFSSSDDNKEQIWGVANPANSYSDLTDVTLDFRSRADKDPIAMSARVRIDGGAWLSTQSRTITDGAYTDYQVVWSGAFGAVGPSSLIEFALSVAGINSAQGPLEIDYAALTIDGTAAGGGGAVPAPSPDVTGNAGPYPTVLVPRGPSVPHLHAYDFHRLAGIPANTVLGRNTATHNVSALDDDDVFDMTRISRDSLKAPSYVRLFEANIVPAGASEVELLATGQATQIGSPVLNFTIGDVVRFGLDYQFTSVGGPDLAVIVFAFRDGHNVVRPLMQFSPPYTDDGVIDVSMTGYIVFRQADELQSYAAGSAKVTWSEDDYTGQSSGVTPISSQNNLVTMNTGVTTFMVTATIPIGYGEIHFRQGFATKASLRP